MSNKKLFVIILSAVILTSAVTVGAYKIFTKNSELPTLTNSNPNFETIVDSIDYSENLLDSNQVYKERFSEDLKSQGKWIPIKSSTLIKELTTQQDYTQDYANDVQNVSVEAPLSENTSSAQNIAPPNDDETFVEEVSTTNLVSPQNNSNVGANVQEAAETKTVTEKIIYIWQPNDINERSWNPYTNGQWEFTSAGWVWASDYGWGRHCYNYGRWMWTSFAGWVWMPGGRWAPNWVTWRHCGSYNGGSYFGWYPTCPVVYWQDPHTNLIVCNSHFSSNPRHWTIVEQRSLTTKITPFTKVHPEKNIEILRNSGKVKTTNTLVFDDTKLRYNGPNVNVISQATNTNITPKSIEIPKSADINSAGTRGDEVTDPKTVKNTRSTQLTGTDIINNIRRTNVSNPLLNNGVTPTTTNTVKPTKQSGVTITDPVINNPVKSGTVNTEPPTKTTTTTTTTTKTSTTTPKQEAPKKQEPKKQETPKQEPKKQEPKKQEPPKQNPPKQDTPRQNPPPKYEPPKYDPPKQNPPPVYNPPPPRQNPPPKQDPPKQDPPPRQDPPKQDPPKKDDGKR